MRVDIKQTNQIAEILNNLDSTQLPNWGIMTPQHMVEHLIVTMKMSNGGFTVPCRLSPEDIEKYKAVILNPDIDMQKGIKAGGMEGLLDLRYADLETSLAKLNSEIEKFHTHFKENPDILIVNPVMGEIGYEDWITFHNKHFKHHFNQFNLI